MSQNHRYILQLYKSLSDRYTCPACNGKKKFSRYINTTTNEPLAEDCGRCERSDSCGYHKTPSDYFKDNPTSKPDDFLKWKPVPAPPPRPTSFIDNPVFKKTLGFNYINTFINFLIALFGKERAGMLVNKYHIGTTKNGETIFYQVDLNGNVRSGKVMKYNLIDSDQTALGRDCKRDKNVNPNWVHSKLKLENFNLLQCLAGEHLLTDNRTVAIVESAKSAVIASVYFPQFVWVSCESKDGLNLDKLKVLKGRNVVLFPDLGGFDKWTEKSKQMTFCKLVIVSDLLEKIATESERTKGLDLADYLLRLPAPAETLPAVDIPLLKIGESPPAEPDKNFTTILGKSTNVVISDDEFKRNCEIIDFWNKRTFLFDKNSSFIVDGVVIPDIRSVIVNHVKGIHNNNNSVVSVQFLEKVKYLVESNFNPLKNEK